MRNGTYKIEETLPQYFHGEVLQRSVESTGSYFGTIKFQVAFNLAVVWMIVFVSLSKGLRSYGKVYFTSKNLLNKRSGFLSVFWLRRIGSKLDFNLLSCSYSIAIINL